MARSVSEHDHLRYLPMDNTSSNNLLPRHRDSTGTPERGLAHGAPPTPGERLNGRTNGVSRRVVPSVQAASSFVSIEEVDLFALFR